MDDQEIQSLVWKLHKITDNLSDYKGQTTTVPTIIFLSNCVNEHYYHFSLLCQVEQSWW